MRRYILNKLSHSGQEVRVEHFGGNVIFSANTEQGVPKEHFSDAVEAFGMQVLRYPAGQPELAYSEGMVIDGKLPTHLVDYMEWAATNSADVVVVLPTGDSYPGDFELKQFVTLIMQSFSESIQAFELGNEYWGFQDETTYGEIANESILAIDSALKGVGEQKDIWVQMANAGGVASEFLNASGNWRQRNDDANIKIIDQLSQEAREIVDGTIEHYYFRREGLHLDDLQWGTNLIGIDHSIWESEIEKELTLNITEWNINNTNLTNLGMSAASTLIAQFNFMMKIEVDEAYVWPPQHNSTNDLAGSGAVTYDIDTGFVNNSIGGAVFDMMSSSLVGLEAMDHTIDNFSAEIPTFVYSSEDTIVVYVTSRSDTVEQISYSLGEFGREFEMSSAIQLGYDRSSSDGVYWNPKERKFVEADSTIVDGEEYFLNEHDVAADFTILSLEGFDDTEVFEFSLNPYEIVELTFVLTEEVESEDTGQNSDPLSYLPGNNFFIGTSDADLFNGRSGTDTIEGGLGDDTLAGGSQDDILDGGHGKDRLWGGSGSDAIFGGSGNDFVSGGTGKDSVSGGSGNDSISGESDNDILSGGLGNDIIRGGAGNDHIYGDLGSDLLRGRVGDDFIFGGEGNDFIFGETGDDFLVGGGGSDRLFGGGGSDTMESGFGDDFMKGGQGDDVFVFYDDMGRDFVMDFDRRYDEVHIDALLLNGQTSGQEVIDDFGEFINGRATLNFGDGNMLIFNHFTNFLGLSDDIEIF